jgi:hypothetical protein
MEDLTHIPPRSLNGWGQMVQGQLARHNDRLRYHEHRLRTQERALWELHKMVRRALKAGSSEKPSWLADLARENWWKICGALFFLGVAYGKTGKLPLGDLLKSMFGN